MFRLAVCATLVFVFWTNSAQAESEAAPNPPSSGELAGLPPEVQADLLAIELETAIKAGDRQATAAHLAALKPLADKTAKGFWFIQGKALAARDWLAEAKTALEAYLSRAGREGKHYKEALTLYAGVSKQAAAAKAKAESPEAKFAVGKRLFEQGDQAGARKALETYLAKVGRKGKHYKEALKLYVEVEAAAEPKKQAPAPKAKNDGVSNAYVELAKRSLKKDDLAGARKYLQSYFAKNKPNSMFYKEALKLNSEVEAASGLKKEAPAPRPILKNSVSVAWTLHARKEFCDLFNENTPSHGITCAKAAKSGSVYNINAIRQGDLDVGITQSHWQHRAYHGTWQYRAHRDTENKKFPEGAFKNLRALFSLDALHFNVIARKSSNYKGLRDLKDGRIWAVDPQRAKRKRENYRLGLMKHVLAQTFFKASNFSFPDSLGQRYVADALCDAQIDAYIEIGGHPHDFIERAARKCPIQIVPIDPGTIRKLVAVHPYYALATVPRGLYWKQIENAVTTFGLGQTIVSSTNTSERLVYELVKAVFEKLGQIRKWNDRYKSLKARRMIRDYLSAPLHPGALRYYREKGWM